MKTTLIPLVILSMIFMGFQIGWGQDPSDKIKYEINGVYELPRFSMRNVTSESMRSSARSPNFLESGSNMSAEVGVTYRLHERHMLAGKLGAYFVTSSVSVLEFDRPIAVTMSPTIFSLPIRYTNRSARFELSHRYLLHDNDGIQLSFNSGLGLRYWSWSQTSEINYNDLSVDPNPIPLGEYTSSSIRPLHPDINLGFTIVLKGILDNMDLSFNYTYLWTPLNAYRMDSLIFRDGAEVESQFQFDNRVNFLQARIGIIFSLEDKKASKDKGS